MENVKQIADRKLYPGIFNKYFADKIFFIRTANKNTSCRFVAYRNEKLIVRAKEKIASAGKCQGFIRFESNVISAGLSLVSEEENNVYSFLVGSLQVVSVLRTEERTSLANARTADGNKIETIFLTDLISDFILMDYIKSEFTKVENAKNLIHSNLNPLYDSVRVYFPTQTLADPRMRFLYSIRRPFHVENINERPADKGKAKIFDFYKKNIYKNDSLLQSNNMLSEATTPLLYKGMIPFGYIQANSKRPISSKDSFKIRKVGGSISSLIMKNDIFKPSREKFPIFDISKMGIGLSFKDRKLIRYFKENSFVHANILLPDNNKTSILNKVKNINILYDRTIKIGGLIVNIDALGEYHFDNFLESVGINS